MRYSHAYPSMPPHTGLVVVWDELTVHPLLHTYHVAEAENWISQSFQTVKSPAEDSYGLVVGPEGGVTERESAFFRELGVVPVRLSPHVLRTETAAFPFLCALQWHRGRL